LAEEKQRSPDTSRALSPAMLVSRRFLRSRLAVAGLVILVAMFLFSFAGGMLMPYGETQVFYRTQTQLRDYASASHSRSFRYTMAQDGLFTTASQAQFVLALSRGETTFSSGGLWYEITEEGPDFYRITAQGQDAALASKLVFNPYTPDTVLSYTFELQAQRAFHRGETHFTAEGTVYTLTVSESGAFVAHADGTPVADLTDTVITAASGEFLDATFRKAAAQALERGENSFTCPDGNGEQVTYTIVPAGEQYHIRREQETRLIDSFASPSSAHPLGTDGYGMDVLTRLMYGGRVSLLIGFIVVLIEVVIGILVGGFAGYFGRWVDSLLMRLVDIVNCIPTMPLFIIIGAIMDGMHVDPTLRIFFLMVLLGITGWAGIARVVRGQILTLREQEFMTAAEALGLPASRRIFRHLIPNVIPQLIVYATMGLGSIIITEATLSFLGLGVKFPYASWGNIITAVNDVHVLTNYWFVWIPAGLLILLTVLGFNFVGDGLRDAFDPKMKR